MAGLGVTPGPLGPDGRPGPRAAPGLRLFCFPYAGGGPSVFRTWPQGLGPAIDVCPVRLPGRGKGLGGPPLRTMSEVVHAAVNDLLPRLQTPFALFGHSMGAVVAFETARCLRRRYGLEPVHLFASGQGAPQLPRRGPRRHDLPEDQLLAELRRLNGTAEAVLADPRLMELYVPLLRADFEALEGYRYVADRPLRCPLTALGGSEEPDTDVDGLLAWSAQTTGPFSMRLLPGDHFFIRSAEPQLLRLLGEGLLPTNRQLAPGPMGSRLAQESGR